MLNKVKENIEKFQAKESFVINETSYTYGEFSQNISNIRNLLESLSLSTNEVIGVVTYNDIETYSTIYALWFCGLCFLPINPLFPVSRNEAVIKQASVRFILSSKPSTDVVPENTDIQFYSTGNLSKQPINLSLPTLLDSDLMYILFTSGSTGVPKGVPINRKNLNGFVDGFYANGYLLDENDKFLQMFDFTFDISVQCYVLPLCIGASIHSIPLDDIKFFTIYQILDKHKITIAKMVPSVIAFLRPYFPKIKLPHLKYSLFSGEALYNEVVAEWSKCVPNAIIQNYYGPTEATIDCLYFTWNELTQTEKTYNGIISIGKTFGDSKAIILSEDGSVITDTEKGELCISGSQVTTGYLNLPEKNATSFVTVNYEGIDCSFYRTGDLVFCNNDGDYMYCGRIDHQVQVQGYRVELGELEHHAKTIAGNIQVAAIAKDKTPGNTQLYLFLENCELESELIAEHLQQVLPYYMQPAKIIKLDTFPLSSSGKINRNQLIELI